MDAIADLREAVNYTGRVNSSETQNPGEFRMLKFLLELEIDRDRPINPQKDKQQLHTIFSNSLSKKALLSVHLKGWFSEQFQ